MMLLLLILLIVIALVIGIFSAIIVLKKPKKKEFVPAADIPVQNKLAIRGTAGVFEGQTFELTDGLLLGRQPDECQICFPPDTAGVSGVHCELRKCAAAVQLTDLGSSYGTFVNGIRIAPNVPVFLQAGDQFDLADTENKFIVSIIPEVTAL